MYAQGKQTLQEVASVYQKSIPTLRKYFDLLELSGEIKFTAEKYINLLFDATFFGRSEGVLIFRANKKNLHWRFIENENLKEVG